MEFETEKAREEVHILRWREIHEIVKTVGSAGVLVAIVALVLTIRHEIPKIRTEVLPNITKQLVDATHEEGKETRKLVLDVAADLSKKVDERADKLQTALLGAVGKTEGDANARISDVVSLAKEQLGKITTTLAETQKSVDRVSKLADPINKTIEGANKTLAKIDSGIVDPLTQCDWEDGNPSCFENRWRGISWDVESFLRTVSSNAPEMTKALQANATNSASVLSNVNGITKDIHDFTDKFVHPPKRKWYQKLFDWFTAGAKLAIYALTR